MKTTYFKKLWLQKRKYQQAISCVPPQERRHSLKMFLLRPIIFFLYQKKHHPFFKTNYSIIGSNPILNLLTIYQLIKEKKISPQTKITIFFTNSLDYWNYDLLEESIFFETLSKNYGFRSRNIEDWIEEIFDFFSQQNIFKNIFILHKQNLFIEKYFQDSYTNFHIFELHEKELTIPKAHPYIEQQNETKKRFIQNIIQKFYSFDSHYLSYKIYKKNYQPILLTNFVILTSLPQGWLSLSSIEHGDIISFEHILQNYSCGSALKIGVSEESLTKISLDSLSHIINKK
jgi:hypothetical protein